MLKVRHRARMRTKDVEALDAALHQAFGASFLGSAKAVDRAEASEGLRLVIADNVVTVMLIGPEERPFPTVRALLAANPPRRHVTVDMGAVKFLMNGADVMAPGITAADPAIQPGDAVWVRDERNHKALAVGEAMLPGAGMPRGPKGKAVRNVQYVGDEVWQIEL